MYDLSTLLCTANSSQQATMVTCEPSVVETQSQVDSGRIYQWIVHKSLTNWIVNLYLTKWISKQWIFNRYLPQGLVMWWCTSPQEEVNNCDLQNLCDIFGQCAFEYCYCLVIFFTTIYFGTFRFVSFTLCYGTYRWDFNNQYAFYTKTPIGGDDVLVSMQTSSRP